MYEGVPHTSELLQIFEDFNLNQYPKKDICLLERKCKCIVTSLNTSMYFLVDFIVDYKPKLIHAIDGIGTGLIILTVNANYILKIYDESLGESYSSCILPLVHA